MINQQVFFREITARLCSSIDIKIAMQRVFDYARHHIPLSVLRIGIFDANLKAIRHIARAAVDQSELPYEVAYMSNELWQQNQAMILYKLKNPSAQIYDPILINGDYDGEQKEFCHAMITLMREEAYSRILVPLSADGELLGTLAFTAWGKAAYNQAHLELVTTVAGPFAIALANALAYEKLNDTLPQKARSSSKKRPSQTWDDIIGGNSGLCNVMEMVQQVAPLNTTVLILGETGTGKEVIANTIHYSSPRKAGPFIKVNCGAISQNLIESELFGHEKGAFTGAVTEKKGQFERANGGTLFLDEIGEMSLESQVRLLRVLQDKEISRVGGEKQIAVDVRVIAATHRNLRHMLVEGQFRADLWYRLNIFPIIIPPLRQRLEDIPLLTRHIVMQKSRNMGITTPPPIAPDAFDRLMNYVWPGNVRELENVVERELICHRGGQLRFESLCPSDEFCEAPHVQELEAPADSSLDLDQVISLHIRKVLKITKGKLHGAGGAAECLGINPYTLRGRMRKLGIPFSR